MNRLNLFVLILLIGSCTSEPSAPKKKEIAKQEVEEKKEERTPKKTYPRLDQESFKEYLLEFGEQQSADVVLVETRLGNFKIRLFEDTPLHRANFLYLVERKYFDYTQFYRVRPDFIIQGGHSDDMETSRRRNDIGHFRLPAEIDTRKHIHTYGAVGAARSYKNNPNKMSNQFEWYVSLGTTYNGPTMRGFMREYGIDYSEEQIEAYRTKGGTPTLDNMHTVFGEVIEGMEVVEAINHLELDGEWPMDIVPMKVTTIEEDPN